MRLTTRTRYAIRAMADLADQPAGAAVRLSSIARRQGVKVKYLEQIFLKLHRAALVLSKRGPGGGYLLARDPKEIKIGHIMDAVGESKAPVFCVDQRDRRRCPRVKYCSTRPYWQELQEVLDSFFDSVTLSDIIGMGSGPRGDQSGRPRA